MRAAVAPGPWQARGVLTLRSWVCCCRCWRCAAAAGKAAQQTCAGPWCCCPQQPWRLGTRCRSVLARRQYPCCAGAVGPALPGAAAAQSAAAAAAGGSSWGSGRTAVGPAAAAGDAPGEGMLRAAAALACCPTCCVPGGARGGGAGLLLLLLMTARCAPWPGHAPASPHLCARVRKKRSVVSRWWCWQCTRA